MSRSSSRPRLLIADHAPTRFAVAAVLDGELDVCAEAGDAEQAIVAAQLHRPDVCLIGSEIPGGGIATLRGILSASPHSAAILLASSADADDLLAAVRAGAVGYLLGSIEPAPLRRVVSAVLAGEAAIPRAMVLELMAELKGTGASSPAGLTQREAQVLGMLKRGQSTSAIADRLEISPVTVRRHISALVNKLGVDDRAALATAAAR